MTTARTATAVLLAVLALAGCSRSEAEPAPSPESLRADTLAVADQVAEHERTHGELPTDLSQVDLDLPDGTEVRAYDPLEPFMFCLVDVPSGAWAMYSAQGDRIVNHGTGAACLR